MRTKIDGLTLIGELRRAGGSDRDMAQQLLREVHQPPILLIGGVELHHRELGVVPR